MSILSATTAATNQDLSPSCGPAVAWPAVETCLWLIEKECQQNSLHFRGKTRPSSHSSTRARARSDRDRAAQGPGALVGVPSPAGSTAGDSGDPPDERPGSGPAFARECDAPGDVVVPR